MKAIFKVGDKVKITNNDKAYPTYKNSFILNSVSNKLFKMFESGYVPHNNTFADVVAVGKHEWGNNIYFIKENGHVSIIGESGIELVESNDEIAINCYCNKVVAKMGKKVRVAKCNETDTFDLYTGVKIAVDRLFGKDNEVKEVKRHAEVGEYIKIVFPSLSNGYYKKGDILKVIGFYREPIGDVHVDIPCCPYVNSKEYVVLENYKSQTEKPKEKKPKYYNGKAVCVEKKNDFLTLGKVYEFKDGRAVDDVGDFLPFGCEVLSLEYLNRVMMSQFIELVEDK